MRVFRPLFAACLLIFAFALPASGQATQCGVARAISFPVDTTQFQIVQDFGAPSPRYQGRYHTGEDWYGGRDSYGTPVRAIADGQVTFSSPNGWGRDGGVIIIAHSLPDGSTAYSMYGHVTDATGIDVPGGVLLRASRRCDRGGGRSATRAAPALRDSHQSARHSGSRLHVGRPHAGRLAATEQIRG